MDNLKEKIEKVVEKIKKDDDFAKKFKSDPVKAVESILGIDLPDEQINKIIQAVKTKITVDTAGSVLKQVKGFLKN